MTNLSISDEFRSIYEDVLNAKAGFVNLPDLEMPDLGDGLAPVPQEALDTNLPSRSRLRASRVR